MAGLIISLSVCSESSSFQASSHSAIANLMNVSLWRAVVPTPLSVSGTSPCPNLPRYLCTEPLSTALRFGLSLSSCTPSPHKPLYSKGLPYVWSKFHFSVDSLALTQVSSVGDNEDSGLVFYFEIYSHYVSVGVGLKLMGILLPQPPKCSAFRNAPPTGQQRFKVF